MDSKLIGGILLIVGTSIGAGMLGLPLATASLGFVGSLFLLLACWVLMTFSAFLILEVNLLMPDNSNLISMAKATLGKSGQAVAWAVTLLLLYSILCAYISGGSDLFHNLMLQRKYEFSTALSAILFTFIFGSVVYMGIRAVDYVNRGLMFLKLGSYLLLVLFLMPLISVSHLEAMQLKHVPWMLAIMVSVTSFSYANIIPSLRIYFQSDAKKLKKAIFIGSLIPLICYIFWDAVIMGIIPMEHPLQSTSDLVNTVTHMAGSHSVTVFVKLFTSICVVTSFLGVGLSLMDFLADGLNLSSVGSARVSIFALAFLPPLFVALYFPNIFIKALHYAGIYCVILFVTLPAAMAWSGTKVWGGKKSLSVLLVISILLIIFGLGGAIA